MRASRLFQFLVLSATSGARTPKPLIAFVPAAAQAGRVINAAGVILCALLLLMSIRLLSPAALVAATGLLSTSVGFYLAPNLLAHPWPFPLRAREVAGIAAVSYGLIIFAAAAAIIAQANSIC